MRKLVSLAGGLVVAAGLVVAGSPPAEAARVVFGFGFGGCCWGPPVYYAPPPVYYAPPPVYYTQPPVVYAPAPVVNPPAPTSAQSSTGQTCREYRSTAIIDGKRQPTRGIACLQPDGTWRIQQ